MRIEEYSTPDLLRQLDVHTYAREPLRFAHEVFGHVFHLAFAPLHQEMAALIFPTDVAMESLSQGGKRSLPCSTSSHRPSACSPPTALAAPRGFGKSKLCSFLLPMHALVTNRSAFTVLVSKTGGGAAVDSLKLIRTEWETNDRLRETYAMLKPNREKWSDHELEFTRTGKLAHKVLATSWGAQLRGKFFLAHRPEVIVLDDMEDEETVDSELLRADLKRWFDGTVLHVNPRAQIVLIGTILGDAALLNRVIRHPEDIDQRAYGHWQRRIFAALELERSTWEAYQSTEQLLLEQERNPESFSQEKQNIPVGVGYKSFDKPEFWTERRWWHDESEVPRDLMISLTVDPAATNREYSDETAICAAGWDPEGRLWVLDLEHGKYAEPDWLLSRIFYHYDRWCHQPEHPGWQFYAVGIEKVGFQKFLIHLFEQEARKRGVRPHVVELKGDRDKTRRIRQLVPLFAQDTIRLRADLLSLELQLRAFPKGVHDDQADALAAHLQLSSILPTATSPRDPQPAPMTLSQYMDLGDTGKRAKEVSLPYTQGLPEVEWMPALWTPN